MTGGTPRRSGASGAAPESGVVHWRDSLHTRIALWTGAITLVLLLLVTAVAAGFARHLVLQDATTGIRNEARAAAKRVDDTLRTVAVTCAGVSGAVTDAELTPEQLTAMLRAMVRATPGATGAMLALEPIRPGEPRYVRRIGGNGKDTDFLASGYPYKSQSWYRRTLASTQGWWSEPYFNEAAGRVWTITYNLPVRVAGSGDVARGMVSMDILLDGIQAQIGDLTRGPGRLASVVAPGGLVAIHPEPDVALHYSFADYVDGMGRSDLAAAAAAVRARRPTAYLHTDPRNGVRWFTAVEPIGDSGGSLLLSESYAQILGHLRQVLTLVLAGGAIAALLCALAVLRLARRISRPVEDLAESAVHLGKGDYQWPVPHGARNDEVGHLARTLDHARTSIQRQLVEIREMGAAQQKLESELAIAHDIQLSMLAPPKTLARGAMRLEAHATLEPAKAVGGDFYGFFERGDELWFAIGDVSDKGVPAALFMARTATVLEVAVRTSASPSAVLAEASRRLVEGNDACMFATVLCGRIDVRSGDCMLANAGHDPPLLLRADGRIERPGLEGGPSLGVDASDAFPPAQCRLRPGDSLVAWTDGVSEAFDAANRAFGEERLQAALRPGYSARDNCARLIAEVHAFAADAPQSDDITVLAIRLRAGTAGNDNDGG